jgi:V/A-type H+-transporting ATPase subunit A
MAEKSTAGKSQRAGKSQGKAPAKRRATPAKTRAAQTPKTPTAKIVAVEDDIVRIEALDETREDGTKAGGKLVKNEVIYILPGRPEPDGRTPRLKAEILRVRGKRADAQVYESTGGIGVGDPVEQSGNMLSVSLGPGLLGRVYDGLQNPLEGLAQGYGVFLPRGVELPALDESAKWSFRPSVGAKAKVRAGDVLGTVEEGRVTHKIMVPFDLAGEAVVTWIQEGVFTVAEPVAELTEDTGGRRMISLRQEWPVRRAIPARLFRQRSSERLYPKEPMITTLRLIDTFFPIARGGMACIPGPFGAGKTVLQNLISRYSNVDVVVVVACGERAGEVVETIQEFPKLKDPRGEGSLMDRTIIICNTSSMPVAAREASIYTGITLGEYYRQMGLDVLLIADSTSRWAQAMRETSGRLEEIPGEEAFPAYLDSSIKGVYERAGVVRTNDGSVGTFTMIGTVSPAGGNFEEPVTQSTLATVKTFLGLSADRAYKRFYPAVDPLLSWSRYLDQLGDWYRDNLGPEWMDWVQEKLDLLREGDAVLQMMQVTGEEGVTLDDFLLYLKASFVDTIYLQQDAFDAVDVSVPLDRQKELFELMRGVTDRRYAFEDKAAARDYFTRVSGLFKNLNYETRKSPRYQELLSQIESLQASIPVIGEGETDDVAEESEVARQA